MNKFIYSFYSFIIFFAKYIYLNKRIHTNPDGSKSTIWVQKCLFIDNRTTIGDGTIIFTKGLSLYQSKFGTGVIILSKKASIGDNATIGDCVIILSNIKLGIRFQIGNDSIIYRLTTQTEVTIGCNTYIGTHFLTSLLYINTNIMKNHDDRLNEYGIKIGKLSVVDDNCTIGNLTMVSHRTRILHGSTIGLNCFFHSRAILKEYSNISRNKEIN